MRINYALLSDSNSKANKSIGYGYITAILHLAPSDVSGRNVCPNASKGCKESCLFTSGRAGFFKSINESRVRKTKMFFNDRDKFLYLLNKDIRKLISKCRKENMKPAVRLNGTSDLPWYKISPDIFTEFNDVNFYDYTKVPRIAKDFIHSNLPGNLHITFSQSEENIEVVKEFLGRISISMVVDEQAKGKCMSSGVKSFIDGDDHDLRFLDPVGSIVLLKEKGKAKHDNTGFVFKSYKKQI